MWAFVGVGASCACARARDCGGGGLEAEAGGGGTGWAGGPHQVFVHDAYEIRPPHRNVEAAWAHWLMRCQVWIGLVQDAVHLVQQDHVFALNAHVPLCARSGNNHAT